MAVLRPTDTDGRDAPRCLGRAAPALESIPMKITRRPSLAAALGVLVGWSCNINVQSVFTCLTDEDCIAEGGAGGVCEPNSMCTFPDAACPSGKRWHHRAAELADKCYEPGDIGGTDTVAATAGSSGGSGSGSGSGSSGPAGSTTIAVDDSAGSSSGPPPMTDGGSSSSGGMVMECDGIFGAAPGYILCEETVDTCSFNATLTMTSCDAMCMMFGSTCVEAYTNTASDCASIDVATTCDDATAVDHICVCQKP
jgi:hypothetical protein